MLDVTRASLADALYREVSLAHGDCGKLVDDVFNEIARALVEDAEVMLSTFGSFRIRHKKERIGQNPKTGERAVISARRVVVFKPAQNLKRRANTIHIR